MVFWGIVKMELTLYRRGFWLWISLLSLVTYLIYGYDQFSKVGLGAGAILQASSFILMAAALLGLLAGVLMAQRERDAQFEEVTMALPGNHLRPFAKIIAWLMIVLLIMVVTIAVILMLHLLWESELLYFWGTTVTYILLYWGATLFVCGMIGYAVQQLLRSYWSYPLLFMIWIAITPYNQMFLPKKIALLLNQGERDPHAGYSDIHGLDVSWEAVARHLFLFAVALFLVSVSVYLHSLHTYQKSILRNCRIAIFITLILALLITPFAVRDSRLDLNDLLFDDLYTLYFQDIEYYQQFSQESNSQFDKTTSPPFQVESYQIKLKHHRFEIAYLGELAIVVSDPEAVEWLSFTLYHGLEVLDLYLNNETVEWERDGDYLKVKWDRANQRGKLQLKVKGTTGYKNPIDPSSFYLASSFPWYPIPGEWRIAEVSPQRSLHYKNLELLAPTRFQIEVEQRGKVFSNLQTEGKNQFAGEARGVTLLYGKFLESHIEGKHIVAPADFTEKLRHLVLLLQAESNQIAENLEVNPFQIPEHIFIVPFSSSINLYPIEVTSDQIFFSAEDFNIYYNHLGKLFANPQTLLPTLYWYNQYHHEDGLFPFLAPALYDHLYGVGVDQTSRLERMATEDFPPQWENYEIVQEFARRLITLAGQGQEKRLEELLKDWYKEVQQGYSDEQILTRLLGELEAEGRER